MSSSELSINNKRQLLKVSTEQNEVNCTGPSPLGHLSLQRMLSGPEYTEKAPKAQKHAAGRQAWVVALRIRLT